MNAESKINIHYSSLVGLKDELLRKQAQIDVTKAKQENFNPFNKTKTKDITANVKQKMKKLVENKKLNEEDIESMRTLQKSKLMLQAKSRLYEKLSKAHKNINPNFLVDFINKPDDSNCFEKEYEKVCNDYKSDYDYNSEWVEYTDCFGRTRKCLQEDLPKMQEKDEFIRKRINDNPHDQTKEQLFYIDDKLSRKEPEIELMRKKWEEQTAKLTNKINIHYEDILFDEARTHGVGYYAFSQDEEERAKQQENLLKLRKETEQKQKENQEINEMKNKLQQNRLKVARLRQRIRAGLPIKDIEEEMAINDSMTLLKSEDNENQKTMISNKKEYQSIKDDEMNNCEQSNELNPYQQFNKQETTKNKLVDIENKIQTFEQLLGKRNYWYIMSQEEWICKKRKERTEEFRPTYENFKNSESLELNKFTNNHIRYKDVINSSNFSDSNNAANIEPISISHDNSNLRTISSTDKLTFADSVLLSPNKSNFLKPSTITENNISQSLKGL